MALINENSTTDNLVAGVTGNTLCNQVSNFYSQTMLLNNKIDFKSENEFDDDSDDDFPTSIEKLKKKYNVLTANQNNNNNNNNGDQNNNDQHKKVFVNYSSLNSIKVKQLLQKNSNNNNNNVSHDGNELGEPKRILYPKENIKLEWEKPCRVGVGLTNLGNTCFMNSILQSLTYCPPLYNFLISLREDGHPSKCRHSSSFCMLCLMLNHVTSVFNREDSFRPIRIFNRLKCIVKHFSPSRQEDAHEFLRYLIDHMTRACLAHHEWESNIPGFAAKLDHLTKATTAINHIFGGYHRSQVSCMQCRAKSNTYDYFMDFMLDIQHVSSLEEALKSFVNPEILKHENAYKCLKCKKPVIAKKQFTVYRAPNVATFQLKRFECNRMPGKILKFVSYPEKFDLRPFMSENTGSPIHYKLLSVLVHSGTSCNSGHYYCYVRNSNNCWYKMDDDKVHQVGLNEVLNQKAYILFYIRLPKETTEKNLQLKLNIQNSTPKLSLNNDILSQKIQNVNNNNNSNSNSKIFNASFKFSPSLFPSSTSTLPNTATTNTVTQPQIKSTLDENNNLKNINNNNSNKEKKPENSLKLVINTANNHLSLLNGQQQTKQQSTITNNCLVPYKKDDNDDSDEDDDDENLKVQKIPHNKSAIESSTEESKQMTKVRNETILQSKETKTIPSIKVKATTNSWQVVETCSENENDHLNKSKHRVEWNSNWKISKNFDSNNIQANSSDSSSYQSGFESKKLMNDFNEDKIKKNKKKKRKKDKSRKRKHNDDSDQECDMEDVELDWVERTKETLELENNKRAKLEPKASSSNQSSSSSKSDILGALLKNASNGYGDVKTWNGNESSLYKSQLDNRNSLDYDDEYNDEFDKGKVSKPKNKINPFSLLSMSNGNPFQVMQQAKYGRNNEKHNNNQYQYSSDGDNNHHHGSSSSKKIRFQSSMTNGNNMNKSSSMNSGTRDYFKQNNNNNKYYKSNHNSFHHHNHHSHSSNNRNNNGYLSKNNHFNNNKCR